MTTANATQNAGVMPADAAYATLLEEVYVPAFREKLAGYGFQINTSADLEIALQNAAQLRELYDAEQHEKQAGHNSVFAQFGQHMQRVVQAADPVAATAGVLKTAAAQFSTSPRIAHAALSIMQAGMAQS